MITGMLHTGFVVRDLDEAVRFDRDAIGLTGVATRERNGGPIDQVVGYDNTHLKIALLNMGGGHVLELIQYVHPTGSERPSEERNTLGAAHLAFNVNDINQTYKKLVSHGAHKLNPPIELVPGRWACYLQDPDRNWIELVEA